MQIPGYRVIRKINQGGMSTVYLAIQISVGRIVALKVMNPQLNNDPAFSERFQREATIVGQLSHPNIVAIYDIGRHEDLNYIAMDYLPNGSVHDKTIKGLSAEEALRVTKEIANALDYAHEKGYIHRDIKPENILFRGDDSAVLSDFGVAKALAINSRMTHVGTVVGTPHYMSPEQTKGNTLDGRSDLYSLGIVLYEMLTGTLPFQGNEAVTIALKHISAPIPRLPLQHLSYQKILDKLLAKDPHQRFQRGRELTAAIEELEKIYYSGTPITTQHPADLNVVNLFKALVSATHHALSWRWNKIANLRWMPGRGFYFRPSTNITDIFSYEQSKPTVAFDRALQNTQLHPILHRQRSMRGLAVLVVVLGLLMWCGLSIWLVSSSRIIPTESGLVKNLAVITANIFIDMKDHQRLHAAVSIANSSKSSLATANSRPRVASAVNASLPNAVIALDATTSSAATALALSSNAIASSAPAVIPTYRLTVKTNPRNARIRILNIPNRYEPGILLPPGRYDIEVAQTGYETSRSWVEITDADIQVSTSLTEIITPGMEISSRLTAKIYGNGPEMISIPTGSFLMGYKDYPLGTPVHKVTIATAFAMSKYEITFEDYDIFAQATNRPLPDDNRWGRANRPVINVSYEDALAYVQWLSKTTGKKYRLPSEAEWEYVARAGTKTTYWWGDEIEAGSDKANCRRGCNSKFAGLFTSKTAPVGTYPANNFGVYDTAGNVAEWVQDCFVDNYHLHPKNGQAFEQSGCASRTVRGGSAKDSLQQLSSHIRGSHPPKSSHDHLGFRVVMELR